MSGSAVTGWSMQLPGAPLDLSLLALTMQSLYMTQR